VKTSQHNQTMSVRRTQQPVAMDLAVAVPFVTSEDTNATVLEVFGQYRDLISLPVLDSYSPIGLISRNIFMSQMSRPYHRELYEKKSCIAFMDKEPLIVDAEMSIETLGAKAVAAGNKTLADGFLIVDKGQLAGLGSGLDLMRTIVDLQIEKNKQVMQSIDYASVIQRAMFSSSKQAISSGLPDSCLMWQPRDIVGGDFYYFEQFDHGWFAAIADCTGHGVPGAFLTLLATSSLKQALHQHGPSDPALIMSEVNRAMKRTLGQHTGHTHLSESDDGMDAAFMWMSSTDNTLTVANARMALMLLPTNEEEAIVLHADRLGPGYLGTPQDTVWTNTVHQLQPGSIFIAVSDGVIDQIGGPKHIAFGKQRLRRTIVQHRELPMPALADALMYEHEQYQGTQKRRDDVTIFGFRHSV
jgi:sigma-B regulation protein RsbU (phosphoserine phosphatase)